jgi:hypothetical protein
MVHLPKSGDPGSLLYPVAYLSTVSQSKVSFTGEEIHNGHKGPCCRLCIPSKNCHLKGHYGRALFPNQDREQAKLSWHLVPFATAPAGALEKMW